MFNGRWPEDFEVDVYRHLGGSYNLSGNPSATLVDPSSYTLDPEGGKLSFFEIQGFDDQISVDIRFSNKLKFYLEIENHGDGQAIIENMSLMYNVGNKTCCSSRLVNRRIC